MRRHHLRQAVRRARLSRFEEHSLLLGIVLLVAAPLMALVGGPGGLARGPGTAGLAALAGCALSRGVRLYRAGTVASLPSSVGRTLVRVRPGRVSTAITVAFALVAPAAAGIALVALVEWGWLALAGFLLVASAGMLVKSVMSSTGQRPYTDPTPAPTTLLERLCIRADVPVPELVVEAGLAANAWTSRGRIHLTKPLLKMLDQSELEAVLAHELAHLAHRDAAVMDVCSAPSRVLLGFAGSVASGFRTWLRDVKGHMVFPGLTFVVALLAALSVPAAFLLGWVSRLSVLRMSRTREFAADAAAATLTGRPSALASALLKLDRQGERIPRADLRQVEARAVLCILGSGTSRLGPPFSTHPPTAARVKRLEAIEQRVQCSDPFVRITDQPAPRHPR